MPNQEHKQELVSQTFNRAQAKLRLVRAYLNLCICYQNGSLESTEDVATVLEEALKDLDAVGAYVPDCKMR
ncbi:MAG: hypothetical protein PHN64_03320 [Desulfovibrionaceae bacterium]|nr:hypothetical protein [Desulfovibrionaceae bacterium]